MTSTIRDNPRAPTSSPALAAVVVGGGPAGLAAAAALRRHGVRAAVLEQGAAVGAAWRGRYDRLRLNTSRFTSRLPGLPYPPEAGLFPPRDAFAAYLERAAAPLDVRPETHVSRIEQTDAGWRLRTSSGDLEASAVVVATGYAREPVIPAWPGRERFRGELLHSARYREPTAFANGDVIVAGAGSSGMEIAYDLVGHARRVRIGAVLAHVPPRLADALDRPLRRLVLGDLTRYGLRRPPKGVFARLRRLGVAPAVVDREVIKAIRDGRISFVGAVVGFDGGAVKFADGASAEPDVVIAATGYRCGLEPLVGHLGVLDERGIPRDAEAAPGLHFVGFTPVPGQIRRMGVDARRTARAIAQRR